MEENDNLRISSNLLFPFFPTAISACQDFFYNVMVLRGRQMTHMSVDPSGASAELPSSPYSIKTPRSPQPPAPRSLLTSSKRQTFASWVCLYSLLNHIYSLKGLQNAHIMGTMNACCDPFNLKTLNEQEKLPLKPQSPMWVGVCERVFVCVCGRLRERKRQRNKEREMPDMPLQTFDGFVYMFWGLTFWIMVWSYCFSWAVM